MHPSPGSCSEVFLNPGDCYFADRHTRMRTVLGSCVAVTLWHPVRHMGGMCHFLLPERLQQAEVPSGRYGVEAMDSLLLAVRMSGTHIADYEFKLFGGSRMFVAPGVSGRKLIGDQNVDFARRLLRNIGARLVSEHSGGNGSRALVFDVWSGDVWLRYQEGSGETEARIRPGNRSCQKKSVS